MGSRIKFFDADLKKEFDGLPKEDPIKKALNRAFEDIKENVGVGRLITKNAHKKKGIKNILNKYSINNIRIYNLPSAWRLLYSVSADEIEVLAVILDWMNHKDYEKLLK